MSLYLNKNNKYQIKQNDTFLFGDEFDTFEDAQRFLFNMGYYTTLTINN